VAPETREETVVSWCGVAIRADAPGRRVSTLEDREIGCIMRLHDALFLVARRVTSEAGGVVIGIAGHAPVLAVHA